MRSIALNWLRPALPAAHRALAGGCAAVLLWWTSPVPADDAAGSLAAGIAAFNRGDVTAAIRHLRRSADAGVTEAQVRLAYLLDQAEQDVDAAHYYRLAAEANSHAGQLGLAGMYAKGEGLPLDFDEARRWMITAADNGNVEAMMILSYAYEQGGLGVDVDRSEALRWADLAARSGDATAAARVEKLSRRPAATATREP